MFKLIVTLIFVATAAQAGIFPPGMDLRPIKGAQLFCSWQDGMYAINLTEKRVWQTDPGATDGIELQNVRINFARCPNCYDISGSMAGILNVNIKVRGQGWGPVKADVTISDGDKTETFPDWECSPQNKPARR